MYFWILHQGDAFRPRFREFAYKTKGRTRVLHRGNYPTISLSDASIKYWETGRLLDQGEDPRSILSPPLPSPPLPIPMAINLLICPPNFEHRVYLTSSKCLLHFILKST
jgi:hypothetical protein